MRHSVESATIARSLRLARRKLLAATGAALAGAACGKAPTDPAPVASASSAPLDGARTPRELTLLNVSYDPTRELYAEYNAFFARRWLERTGERVSIKQSHGGSGSQSRA